MAQDQGDRPHRLTPGTGLAGVSTPVVASDAGPERGTGLLADDLSTLFLCFFDGRWDEDEAVEVEDFTDFSWELVECTLSLSLSLSDDSSGSSSTLFRLNFSNSLTGDLSLLDFSSLE